MNERVIEIPWALSRLPQAGRVLDVGSADATYLSTIAATGRRLECIDLRDCRDALPPGVRFHHESIIGNELPAAAYDAVLMVSTLEHIGLPCYGNAPVENGDVLAIAETRRLLKPGGTLIATVPAGQSKVASWYRQYSPADLRRLFANWDVTIEYWAFDGAQYVAVAEAEVESCDYRDRLDEHAGAGSVAGVVAMRGAECA